MKPAPIVIAIAAAGALALFAYRTIAQAPAQAARPPTAAECTPAAIRAVADALERSILSARCAEASS